MSIRDNYGREFANLAKMYTEESKYSGENNNFNFKLTVFHDICSRAAVPEEAKARAFPTMLRSLALDYLSKWSRSLYASYALYG